MENESTNLESSQTPSLAQPLVFSNSKQSALSQPASGNSFSHHSMVRKCWSLPVGVWLRLIIPCCLFGWHRKYSPDACSLVLVEPNSLLVCFKSSGLKFLCSIWNNCVNSSPAALVRFVTHASFLLKGKKKLFWSRTYHSNNLRNRTGWDLVWDRMLASAGRRETLSQRCA